MARPNPADQWHGTTILAVRHAGRVAIGGDGQVTLGATVLKQDAVKIRKLYDDRVVVGFAGAGADGLALLERFEAKLRDFQGNVPRAATSLAKEWRTDRALRRLEAMMIALDKSNLLLIGGTGDVLSPSDGILGIGSGGPFAVAAARALVKHSTLSAGDVVREALAIVAGICIYTNQNVVVEEIDCQN